MLCRDVDKEKFVIETITERTPSPNRKSLPDLPNGPRNRSPRTWFVFSPSLFADFRFPRDRLRIPEFTASALVFPAAKSVLSRSPRSNVEPPLRSVSTPLGSSFSEGSTTCTWLSRCKYRGAGFKWKPQTAWAGRRTKALRMRHLESTLRLINSTESYIPLRQYASRRRRRQVVLV